MTESDAPTPDNSADGTGSEPEAVPVSEAAVRLLAEAVAGLSNDSEYFLQALTDMLLAMKPISRERLTESDVRFLGALAGAIVGGGSLP